MINELTFSLEEFPKKDEDSETIKNKISTSFVLLSPFKSVNFYSNPLTLSAETFSTISLSVLLATLTACAAPAKTSRARTVRRIPH